MVTLVFSDTEDPTTGNDLDFDYGAIFSSSCAEIVGQTVVICLISRAGRAQITSLMYLLGGVSVFLLCFFASDRNADRPTLVVLSFVARGFAMGASSMTWIVTAELLPTQIRTSGHSAANAVARLGGAVSPFLITANNDMLTIGIVMGCVSILTSMVAWHLPDSSGIIGTAGKDSGVYGSDGKRIQESELL